MSTSTIEAARVVPGPGFELFRDAHFARARGELERADILEAASRRRGPVLVANVKLNTPLEYIVLTTEVGP